MDFVYDITRNDTETVNRFFLHEIVDFPDSCALQCNVTAKNAVDKTQTSISLSLSKFVKQLDLKNHFPIDLHFFTIIGNQHLFHVFKTTYYHCFDNPRNPKS